MFFSAPDSPYSAPDTPSNAADIEQWWDDDRSVANWIGKVDEQVKQIGREPASADLHETRRQHATIERITQEIAQYEGNVTSLENKANVLIEDPVTRDEDRQGVDDEVKSVKKNWNELKENAFNVERKYVVVVFAQHCLFRCL